MCVPFGLKDRVIHALDRAHLSGKFFFKKRTQALHLLTLINSTRSSLLLKKLQLNINLNRYDQLGLYNII